MNDFSSINVMNEIHDLQQFFTAAHTQLQAGQVVNMSGVENRISRVCQAAQQAAPEQQQTYLPELTVLISLLNTYEQDLRTIQASLKSSNPENDDNGKSGS